MIKIYHTRKTMAKERKMDVLICVGNRDVDFLLDTCIRQCVKNFKLLGDIYLVCENVDRVKCCVDQLDIRKDNIFLIDENDTIPSEYHNAHGWYKQQIIKLYGDTICKTELFCCLGADTILLKEIGYNMLFDNNDVPILYYNRYPKVEDYKHLKYERERVINISKILKTEPVRSYLLGDFIMDFCVFNSEILVKIREYLSHIYGGSGYENFIVDCTSFLSLEDKNKFGEWTIYAMFILDILNLPVTVKNSNYSFFSQIHSSSDLEAFEYKSCIAHFVDKRLDKNIIISKVIDLNLEINVAKNNRWNMFKEVLTHKGVSNMSVADLALLFKTDDIVAMEIFDAL